MTINNLNKYDANFTAGGILYNEFIALKQILLSDDFDELIKIEELQNNFIGVSTKSARQRILIEIKRRYKSVSKDFWDYFFSWNETEQKLALFYLCLKSYPLLFDLHFEVALKKFRVGSNLEAFDIQMKMDEISSRNNEISQWSEATLKKINVQYRKALKDCGLYNGKMLQRETKASESFWDYFKNTNEQWFLEACFEKI